MDPCNQTLRLKLATFRPPRQYILWGLFNRNHLVCCLAVKVFPWFSWFSWC